MSRHSTELALSRMAKDFVFKYGPCHLNQLIYGLEIQVLEDIPDFEELLYWVLKKLIHSGEIQSDSRFYLQNPNQLRSLEVTFNRPFAGTNRASRGFDMTTWGTLYVANEQISSGCNFFFVERAIDSAAARRNRARTYVASAYHKTRQFQSNEDPGLDVYRYYIFNGETKQMGNLKMEVDALSAADSVSNIVIVSDTQKVFDIIPEIQNPLTVYFFNSLPRVGNPQVDIFRRNF